MKITFEDVVHLTQSWFHMNWCCSHCMVTLFFHILLIILLATHLKSNKNEVWCTSLGKNEKKSFSLSPSFKWAKIQANMFWLQTVLQHWGSTKQSEQVAKKLEPPPKSIFFYPSARKNYIRLYLSGCAGSTNTVEASKRWRCLLCHEWMLIIKVEWVKHVVSKRQFAF